MTHIWVTFENVDLILKISWLKMKLGSGIRFDERQAHQQPIWREFKIYMWGVEVGVLNHSMNSTDRIVTLSRLTCKLLKRNQADTAE